MDNNRDFFEELYAAHAAEIAKFIYAAAGSEGGHADDIFQCVWENAYRYLGSLRDKSKVRAWLYAISRNEIKSHFSKRIVHIPLDSKETEEDIITEYPDEKSSSFPEVFAEADLLAQLINRLDPQQQRVVILYYYYDISLKDIASLKNENYNTVKSIYRRAMERLRANAKEIEDGSR